jgi:hypothetical protein
MVTHKNRLLERCDAHGLVEEGAGHGHKDEGEEQLEKLCCHCADCPFTHCSFVIFKPIFATEIGVAGDFFSLQNAQKHFET